MPRRPPAPFAGLSHALVVAAKAPAPGAVKTRLVADGLTAEGAAALAGAFLTDTLDAARHPSLAGVSVTLALDGDPDLLPGAARGVPCERQIGNDLGERLVQMTTARFAVGATAVVVIGSDSPHLPPGFLVEAFGRLTGGGSAADVVLGPSEDGGYYLVGLREPAPELFRDVPWSTDAVLAVTRERAAALGKRLALLPPWYDIDTGAELARLRRDIARRIVDAPHTARALLRGPDGRA